MPTNRVMVPVLLCFDVPHKPRASEATIKRIAKRIITEYLGEIGEEHNDFRITIQDEVGNDLKAKLYSSDLPWCDTFGHVDLETKQ